MTKPENIFLTDKRREVLQGTSDWEDASVANERSRIKNRARLAIAELIEVANSPYIDHTDVFDPDDVDNFIRALLTSSRPDHVSQVGLVEDASQDHSDDLPDDAYPDYTEEFEIYRDRLHSRMARLVLEDQHDDN